MTRSSRRVGSTVTPAQAASRQWDLVVLGAGSAGLVASRTAAALGASVLLVEAGRFGGECLHTGCVPSKALIAAAAAAHAARHGSTLGVGGQDVPIDFGAVMSHVRAAIRRIEPVDAPDALAKDGVHSLRGHARFDGPDAVVVDAERIRFRDAIVATGSAPIRSTAEGAESIDVLTNETFWDLDERPDRLLIQGGGAIGCEIAQAMARLGSSVTLVHRGDRLLAKEDAEASQVVLEALRADGVDVRLKTTVRAVSAAGTSATSASGGARLSDGSDVVFDRMLAALGRQARTGGLGLEVAGVVLDASGAVAVDRAMKTSNPRIRAAGDVTALPRFTHTAGMYASVAATNAVLGLSRAADLDVVPRVTFTSPEVGAVGVDPAQAPGRGMRVIVQQHAHLDRAIADGHTDGFTKIVVDRRGRVAGAVIVGPRAGESLAEYTVATRARLSVNALASTIHAYPTYSDAGWNAVVSEARRGLGRGAVSLAIRGLSAVRRRRA